MIPICMCVRYGRSFGSEHDVAVLPDAPDLAIGVRPAIGLTSGKTCAVASAAWDRDDQCCAGSGCVEVVGGEPLATWLTP